MNNISRTSGLRAAACVALVSTGLIPAFSQAKPNQAKPDSIEALRAGFLNPPDSAKPMVRWWWFGAAVEKPEILKELQQMKADNIGGAELAFVYPEVLDDPAKGFNNLPFLSPGMLDAVTFAKDEGKKLGLRIDVTLCSGWPYGGPATTLEQAATRLRTVEIGVPAGATTAATFTPAEGESIVATSLVEGSPTPVPVRRGGAPEIQWKAETAKPFTPGGNFPASSTARVVIYFIQSHTKQQVKRAAVGAEGYVLDPFSHDAVATHLKAVGEPLIKAFGATPPYAIFSDSLEAYGADWTPKLPEEFKRRRGYDLIPRLPELVAGGSPAADKVRHDYGVTLTELVNENYLTQINDWAKAHGTKFRSQTYGEPAVDFSSQNLVGLAEGEGPQWRAFSTLRWATSANHVFGHNVTSGETFTWLHSPVFRATPLDMKAEADIDFIMGENQLVFHGWPYSPPVGKVPEPGWSLYAAASFNDHNPWHPVLPAVDKYIQRVSWLLRQGEPANQVAILVPTDDAWASFAPLHTTVTGAMQKLISPELMSAILSAGYNVDYIDAKALVKVGMGAHQVLVIPPTDRISVGTVRAINGFIAKGGKVTMVGRVPTMDDQGNPLSVTLSEKIPVVGDAASLERELPDAVKPDLSLIDADENTRQAVGFVRRKLRNADVYFIVNTSNRTITTKAKFGTERSLGHEWNPETGTIISDIRIANEQDLVLAPYQSRMFIFDYQGLYDLAIVPPWSAQVADLTKDWQVRFIGSGQSTSETELADWTLNSATLHYSGEAVCSRDFTYSQDAQKPIYLAIEGGTALPGAPNSPPEHAALGANGLPDPLVTRTGPGMHAYFDPPVKEAALVYINGKEAGALWHPPYRLDVTKLLKPGVNHIEIHVYNTALNAWSALPPHDYKPLIEKYGDRFQMQDLDKVKPVSSGILGTIKLVAGGGQ